VRLIRKTVSIRQNSTEQDSTEQDNVVPEKDRDIIFFIFEMNFFVFFIVVL
jgi:hypothetical protein